MERGPVSSVRQGRCYPDVELGVLYLMANTRLLGVISVHGHIRITWRYMDGAMATVNG